MHGYSISGDAARLRSSLKTVFGRASSSRDDSGNGYFGAFSPLSPASISIRACKLLRKNAAPVPERRFSWCRARTPPFLRGNLCVSRYGHRDRGFLSSDKTFSQLKSVTLNASSKCITCHSEMRLELRNMTYAVVHHLMYYDSQRFQSFFS